MISIGKFIKEYNDVENNKSISDVGNALRMGNSTVRRYARTLREEGYSLVDRTNNGYHLNHNNIPDQEVIDQSIRLAKEKQKLQDKQRIERKSFREYARKENAIEEYIKALTEVFKKNSISFNTKAHGISSSDDCDVVGILQLSDIHFNEEINLPNNTYNFKVASSRLKEYVRRAKKYFKMNDVQHVVVVMTGDMLNSDRRLDELLENATNRSKATFLAVDILSKVVMDLNEDYNVSVVSITGNESRVGKDVGWVTDIAQDNYDFMIHNMLTMVFDDCPGVSFVPIGDNPLERVIDVAGHHILLIHGHRTMSKYPEKDIQKKYAQYSTEGINLDYVLMGHIHETQISDTYARSSGLPGANNYSKNALGVCSRAAQNCFVFRSNGSHEGIKVDLQNVNIEDRYDFDERLECYNSIYNKVDKNETVVFKVVI